ncbi:alpha beta hydrolase fold-1 protein [Curvularia clavata]|uniref:Alpha beta hydrolase fold-1 protein n=1 Tax=Curvularia clavata TaxID=95742 RepID=A0A9Q8Z9F4_CURCL|nr:alpha beta hydrolase fold-1 protein [Curvularia clavata]
MAIGHRITAPYAGQFDPTRFVTSWALPPSLLFGYRALLALYAFTTLFTIFGWNGTHGRSEESRHSFSFFTNLTYWGLAFYYAFSAVHTASYWLTGTSFLARWPKPLQVAHSMFYSTIVVYPWIVTIVFWGLLAADFPTTFSVWSNTSQHALNSFYAFCEIVFPRTNRLPWLDLIPIIILLALYLALAYVTHATEGFYVYPFLDLQKHSSGVVGGYIIGILIAAIIVFIIIRYLIALRVWVTETKLGMRGKFSPHAPANEDIPLHHNVTK